MSLVTCVEVSIDKFGRLKTAAGRYAAEVDDRVPPESMVAWKREIPDRPLSKL
jgi:hypothetical protein